MKVACGITPRSAQAGEGAKYLRLPTRRTDQGVRHLSWHDSAGGPGRDRQHGLREGLGRED